MIYKYTVCQNWECENFESVPLPLEAQEIHCDCEECTEANRQEATERAANRLIRQREIDAVLYVNVAATNQQEITVYYDEVERNR